MLGRNTANTFFRRSAYDFFVGIDISEYKHDCFIMNELGEMIKLVFLFESNASSFAKLSSAHLRFALLSCCNSVMSHSEIFAEYYYKKKSEGNPTDIAQKKKKKKCSVGSSLLKQDV